MEEEQRVAQVELAKQRCKCVIDAINSLPCSTNITVSCRRTLLKLARAELAFLSRPSSSSVPLSSDMLEETEGDWINVIARSYRNACVLEINPADGKDVEGTKSGCSVQGSTVDSSQLEPSVGKAETQPQLVDENARSGDSFHLELSVDEAETQAQPTEENVRINLGVMFCSILMGMKLSSMESKACESSNPGNLLGETDLVNFDTTALIALVSGISNGGTEKLLATPESGMRQRFKGNYDFVIGQITSEIQNPIHMEFDRILRGKNGLICESVLTEFKELVSMCGGPNEKLRADWLINCLRVVPDTPSERMMGLPSTRKLALKNKVVFGTGDHWHAPTLTANMAFVRAVSQTGMSLSTIEHRPRALTGD